MSKKIIAVLRQQPAFVLMIRMPNGIVECEEARGLLLSGMLATAEPTGIDLSITNADAFCLPFLNYQNGHQG